MTETDEIQSRNTALYHAKLLIVDDEPRNVLLLQDMLGQAGFRFVQITTDPRETLTLYRAFRPDLILLDLMMPQMDGIAVMEQLRAEEPGSRTVPILILTADISPPARRNALTKGANDFLNKPFDAVELLLRIGNLLETRFLYLDLKRQNQTLEDRVQVRTAALQTAQMETLERLAKAGEFRDDATGRHAHRVSTLTAMLAERLGFPPERVHWIYLAARLHDVGKIGISDLILLKPGKLTESEFDLMKTHTTIGTRLLEGGQSELIQLAQQIAQSHHERWDGTGYPEGLSGEDIPIPARLLAVADVFDALTHDRPYKKAWPVAEAVAEIAQQSGRQFDPCVVAEFMQLPHESLL